MMNSESQNTSIQERVYSICDDLYKDGTKPTVRRLLSMLPDVKSTSTVHKYFTLWKKEHGANEKSLYDRLGFSTEFTQSFMKEITRFSIQTEQRYKEQAEDANDQRDQAIEDLERADEKLYKQTAVLEQLEKQVDELQDELVKIKNEAKVALEKELESHAATVQELRKQVQESAKNAQTLTEANETLRTELAKANLRLEGNESYVAEVKEQNSSLSDDNKALNIEIARLNKSQAGHEATIQGNDKLIQNLQVQLEKAEQLRIAADKDNVKLDNELDAARKDISTISQKVTETMDILSKEVQKNTEQKAYYDEQIRSHIQAEKNSAATIAGYEKLIDQLEKNSVKSEAELANLRQTINSLEKKLASLSESQG